MSDNATKPDTKPLPDLLTIDEAAQLLRKSKVTMYRYVNDGKVKGYTVSGAGRLLFKRDELLAMLTPVEPGSLRERDTKEEADHA